MISRSTHVCWDCRKVIKGHDPIGWGGGLCPTCGGSMVDMGKRWKPPRKTQDRRWKQQHRLWETGYLPNGEARRVFPKKKF